MKKAEFIKKFSKIEDTLEDEFRAEFNSPELLWKALKKQLTLTDVGSSAWYCEISTINGQWFEIVTGVNETEVAIKIEKAFGKGTKFEIKNEFKLL